MFVKHECHVFRGTTKLVTPSARITQLFSVVSPFDSEDKTFFKKINQTKQSFTDT
jgi:hypothetical protein